MERRRLLSALGSRPLLQRRSWPRASQRELRRIPASKCCKASPCQRVPIPAKIFPTFPSSRRSIRWAFYTKEFCLVKPSKERQPARLSLPLAPCSIGASVQPRTRGSLSMRRSSEASNHELHRLGIALAAKRLARAGVRKKSSRFAGFGSQRLLLLCLRSPTPAFMRGVTTGVKGIGVLLHRELAGAFHKPCSSSSVAPF